MCLMMLTISQLRRRKQAACVDSEGALIPTVRALVLIVLESWETSGSLITSLVPFFRDITLLP
jgi:hypothetical protein